MEATTRSGRRELLEDIAAKLTEARLCNPYGGDVTKVPRGRGGAFYQTLFSYPRNLDGYIAVYNVNHIVVEFQTRYHHLPHRGRFVFKSADDVKEFIDAAFVKLSQDATDAVLARAVREG